MNVFHIILKKVEFLFSLLKNNKKNICPWGRGRLIYVKSLGSISTIGDIRRLS